MKKARTVQEIKDRIKILKKMRKKYKHLKDLVLLFESQIEILEWALGKKE